MLSGSANVRRFAVACAALAGAVMLVVASRQAPPFREVSDGAILEIYTLGALKGKLLVGPYSRFGWHHPGPLFLYLEAPWYWLSGLHTAGMQAGAIAINVTAIAVLLWIVSRLASDAAIVALSSAAAYYVVRTGDMIASVWNPHVIILPMLAFVVVAAAIATPGVATPYVGRVLSDPARGRSTDPPCTWLIVSFVVLGSFLVQTHLAMAPLVAAVGVVAIVASRRARQPWMTACVAAIVLWLPPIVEQLTHRPGNVAKIIRFFLGDPVAGGQSLAVAAAAWASALVAPFRPAFVVALGFDLTPPGASAVVIAAAEVVALIVVAVIARPRDRFAAWLATMCALATVVALAATTRIRERIIDHEIFWMSGLGALNVAAIVAGVAARFDLSRTWRPLARLATAIAFVLVVTVSVQAMRHVLARTRGPEDHAVDVVVEAIQRELSRAGARRPLVEIDPPVWPIAAGALLEIDKQHVRFAVDDRWVTMFGDAFAPTGREDVRLKIAGSPRQPVVTATR